MGCGVAAIGCGMMYDYEIGQLAKQAAGNQAATVAEGPKTLYDDPGIQLPEIDHACDTAGPGGVTGAESEKLEIMQESQRWNSTSKGWSWNNQCWDQADALRCNLMEKGYKYWSFEVIGGSKWFGANHNILAVLPNQPGYNAFTVDPFKYPLVGGRVRFGTIEQFYGSYPHEVRSQYFQIRRW